MGAQLPKDCTKFPQIRPSKKCMLEAVSNPKEGASTACSDSLSDKNQLKPTCLLHVCCLRHCASPVAILGTEGPLGL